MSYFIGVDIGGTKIAGALVDDKGKVLNRIKVSTPKQVKSKDIYACITGAIDELLLASKVSRKQIKGMGLGVPGIVDTKKNHILAAPNIALTNFPLYSKLKQKYRMRIAMSNDVNLGLLGEAWLGVARNLDYVVGIFPGTGVGGAAIDRGHLLLGSQGAATELGHMTMDMQGPLCHCGNHGCLEAVASRWAMERDIGRMIKSGRKSIVKELNNGKLSMIKSRILKESLQKNDAVVKEVIMRASQSLGKASVSINHIFNPQAIVFGGGIVKACGFFMLPIIKRMVKADPFYKKFNACRILQSSLGDDAVPLGAVRLVQKS